MKGAEKLWSKQGGQTSPLERCGARHGREAQDKLVGEQI